ncbi:hypothetical protein V5F49_15520 [Xanthobacter sp. V3C-3]|uniref:hypothetical protein n=1 Tax=Xanthobacter lutulentifluminis TaxID=3119935 RepID=UPI0037297DD1
MEEPDDRFDPLLRRSRTGATGQDIDELDHRLQQVEQAVYRIEEKIDDLIRDRNETWALIFRRGKITVTWLALAFIVGWVVRLILAR